MKLTPLHDWAVIVPSEAEIRTAGGLYIPETAKEKPEEGLVEAIGPGAYEEEKRGKKKEEKKERKFIPTQVKPGDRVLYERYAGQTYTIGNEERILVRERDILGHIERPLRIPAVTTPRTTTMIMARPASPLVKVQTPGKTTAGRPVKKAAKKSTRKPAAKPSPTKSSKKKASKKTAKKTVKKTVKNIVKKAASKSKKAAKVKSKKR
jgi:chaperonin GroES